MRKVSDKEHSKHTVKTKFFFNPCSITKIFCAPIARIKLNPVKKPNIKKFINNIKDSLKTVEYYIFVKIC